MNKKLWDFMAVFGFFYSLFIIVVIGFYTFVGIFRDLDFLIIPIIIMVVIDLIPLTYTIIYLKRVREVFALGKLDEVKE